MNVAVEINPLAESHRTGIGNVTLHYLQVLQKIDSRNDYFLYVFSEQKDLPLRITNPRWRIVWYVTSNLHLKKRLEEYIASNFRSGISARKLLIYIPIRVIKMILELIDRIYYYLRYQYSFRKNNIEIMVLFSPHLFPRLVFRKPVFVGLIYDLVWKLFPETMERRNRSIMEKRTIAYLNRMTVLISISDQTKRDAIEMLDARVPIFAIPLAADRDIFFRAGKREIERIRNHYHITGPYILTVATLEPRKNLFRLIEAFNTMKAGNRYSLVIVGMKGWGEGDFHEFIQSTPRFDKIMLTGYVPDRDLAPLYSGAEIFVFPSLYEGFGLPILEAMQCGCPVITSDSSSMPEVAGDAAILVNPNDVTSIASAMDRLASNKKSRNDLARAGIERARQFSWEISSGRLLEVIESIDRG